MSMTRDIAFSRKVLWMLFVCIQLFQGLYAHNKTCDSLIEKVTKTEKLLESALQKILSLEAKVDQLERKNQDQHMNATGDMQAPQDHVAFYAYMSSTTQSPGKNHALIFDVVKTNVGGGYSPSTGTFVCPSGGLYVFTATALSNGYIAIDVLVNSVAIGTIYPDGGMLNPWATATGVYVYPARAGDVISVRTRGDFPPVGDIKSQYNMGKTSFAGWKLYN